MHDEKKLFHNAPLMYSIGAAKYGDAGGAKIAMACNMVSRDTQKLCQEHGVFDRCGGLWKLCRFFKTDVTKWSKSMAESYFMNMCLDGNSDIVRIMLQQYKQSHLWWSGSIGITMLNSRVRDNYAIQIAAHNGYVDIVRILLALKGERKVDASANKNYAIQWASLGGHTEVVRELLALDNSRQVDAAADNNFSIQMASAGGFSEIVNMLLTLKGDRQVNASSDGEFSIRWASRNGHIEVVNLLLALKGDRQVNASKGDTCAPICAASENGHVKVVAALLALDGMRKVDPTAHDNYAVKVALENGHLGVLKLLLKCFQ